jgi:hypothetical protein
VELGSKFAWNFGLGDEPVENALFIFVNVFAHWCDPYKLEKAPAAGGVRDMY